MIGCRNLTDDEIRSISSVLSIRDRCLFILGIRTGYRIRELISLNVCDVFDGTRVKETVKISKCNVKGKTASRSVPMHPEASALILEYLESYPVRKWEFPLFRTNPVRRMHPRTFHNALKAACIRAEVDGTRVSSHALRKSFAARLVNAGCSIYELQVALSHKNISSTARYVSVDETRVWNLIKGLK